MKLIKGMGLVFSLVFFFIVTVDAYSSDKAKCESIKDGDDRNLCLALLKDKEEGKEFKDRYRNKDHRIYYCSLIRTRDKQNYCNAIVKNEKRICGLIADSKLEADCNAKTK